MFFNPLVSTLMNIKLFTKQDLLKSGPEGLISRNEPHTQNITTGGIQFTCQYIIRRAFKLFDNETRLSSVQRMVGSLRLTSKSLNNSICDELSLEVMHRWMKGLERAALVTKRINQLLQKRDYTGLFMFMDAVVKVFARRESVRLLSSFLITITQHHKHILKEYITFFTSQRLHMTIREYYAARRNFPFPGFKPEHVEQALQIANENGWIEESLFLFKHFSSHYLSTTQDQGMRTALKKGQKLNFDARLGNRISNLSRNREDIVDLASSGTRSAEWLSLYFDAKQCTTNDLMKVLSNVSVTHIILFELLEKRVNNSTKRCRILSFYGSTILKFYYPNEHSTLRTDSIDPSKTKTFTGLILEPECRQELYLYPFYCAVVTNDIEQVKQIHQQYGITIDHFGHQPHPLNEYLTAIKRIEPMQEMIDYLVQHFDGVQQCMKGIVYTQEEAERLWPISKQLIQKGAKVHDKHVWIHLFKDKTPRNVLKFERLLDDSLNEKTFLLEEFSRISLGMITETKLLLLARRYGGTDCHLTALPKELLQLIMDFADEPPLFIQFANCIVEKCSDKIWFRGEISSETLERTGEIAKFFCGNDKKIMNPMACLKNYASQRAVKRDAKYLTKMFVECCRTLSDCPQRVHRYFCKYGTDDRLLNKLALTANTLVDVYTHLEYPTLEYAAVAKNMKLLHAFYQCRQNTSMILDENLYAKVAPNKKDQMSFDEALQLVNEVRRHYVN